MASNENELDIGGGYREHIIVRRDTLLGEMDGGEMIQEKQKRQKILVLRKMALRGNAEKLSSIVKKLPEAVDSVDSNGATPLHHAAFNGHVQCMKILLKYGASVDAADADGCTP